MTIEKNETDSIILATGGYDHTIKLWQTHTGICQRTMQHAESVNGNNFSKYWFIFLFYSK